MTFISHFNFMHVLLYRGLNLLYLHAKRINPKSKVLTAALMMQLPTLRRGCQMESYTFLKTIPKTKAASSTETSAIIHQSTWRHLLKYLKLRISQLLYFSHRLIFQKEQNQARNWIIFGFEWKGGWDPRDKTDRKSCS